MGVGPSRKTGCGGQQPTWRPQVCEEDTAQCWGKEGGPWDERD